MPHKHNLVVVFLYGIVALLPGLAMMLGHWFPWRPTLGRDLTKLESYIWGTAWIVGVAAAGMRISRRLGHEFNADQCARLVEVSASSAGSATILAYLIDYWTGQRRRAMAQQMASSQRGSDAN